MRESRAERAGAAKRAKPAQRAGRTRRGPHATETGVAGKRNNAAATPQEG